MKNNSAKLETEIKNTISSEYNVPFNGQAGTLVQFEEFDVFVKGKRPLSIFDKFHNWKNRKNDGGSVTSSNIFEIRKKDGDIIKNIKLQQWPFSWRSFSVGEKDFTITPNGNEAGFVVYDGDIDYARGGEFSVQGENAKYEPIFFGYRPFREMEDSEITHAIISKLKENHENPSDFYIKSEPNMYDSRITFSLIHKDTFENKNAYVVGNRSGKDRTVVYNTISKEVDFFLWK